MPDRLVPWLLVPLLAACVPPKADDTGGAGDSADTGDSGDTAPPRVAPDCASASTFLTWTFDDGATLAPTTTGPEVNAYTFGIGIVATDPNRIWAEHAGTLWRSEDAGCTWSPATTLDDPWWVYAAQPSGVLWGYASNGRSVMRIEGDVVDVHTVDQPALGIGADPADPLTALVGGPNDLSVTTDGGATWSTLAGPGVTAYAWAFDPADVGRIVVGTMSDGAWYTHDRGRTWAHATGLGSGNTNIFTVTWSAADPDVVWAEGLDVDEMDSGAANQGRHVWRSGDGGATFTSVVEQTVDVVLTNGFASATPPDDADAFYFTFGTSFGGEGTHLYRYDHAAGVVTSTHSDWSGASALAFSPVTPGLLYVAVVKEQVD